MFTVVHVLVVRHRMRLVHVLNKRIKSVRYMVAVGFPVRNG
jgi:hypothetical protein